MALVSFAQKLKLIEEVGRLSDSSLVATHHGKFLPAFLKDVLVIGNGPASKASQTRAEAIAKKKNAYIVRFNSFTKSGALP